MEYTQLIKAGKEYKKPPKNQGQQINIETQFNIDDKVSKVQQSIENILVLQQSSNLLEDLRQFESDKKPNKPNQKTYLVFNHLNEQSINDSQQNEEYESYYEDEEVDLKQLDQQIRKIFNQNDNQSAVNNLQNKVQFILLNEIPVINKQSFNKIKNIVQNIVYDVILVVKKNIFIHHSQWQDFCLPLWKILYLFLIQILHQINGRQTQKCCDFCCKTLSKM